MPSGLAGFSKTLADGNLSYLDGLSRFSRISSHQEQKLIGWDINTCEKYLDATGLDIEAWDGFWHLAGEAGNFELSEQVERLLYRVWMTKLAQSFYSRFVNREDIWLKQWRSGDNFGYATIKPEDDDYKPVSMDLIIKHLQEKLTLSLPVASISGLCKWCCWDCDSDSDDLDRLQQSLKELGLNPIREGARQGRSGHLWLFFDEPVSLNALRHFNGFITKLSPIGDTTEFFPKRTRENALLPGGSMRLPLGRHNKPETDVQRSWFDAASKNLEYQLFWLHKQPTNSAVKINRLAEYQQAIEPAMPQPKRMIVCKREPFQQVNILPLVGPTKRIGKDQATACPVCRLEGKDTRGDNLRISSDGQHFNCVLGGPNSTHKPLEILRALGFHAV